MPQLLRLDGWCSAKDRKFCGAHEIEIISLGEREYDLAVQAYADFGKGRHPASLNMGELDRLMLATIEAGR